MEELRVESTADFQRLQIIDVEQLYILDKNLKFEYEKKQILKSEWEESIKSNLDNGAKIVIIKKNSQIIMYFIFMEDTEYNNVYIKNLNIDENYQSNLFLMKKLSLLLVEIFINSRLPYLRFSVHKGNEYSINMYRKFKFKELLNIENNNFVTFEVTREDLIKNKLVRV
ncbi:GNAT family N-acetyltransferase [Culicoidibacter larvae]|uniref:GNAT family N-acetyltransferase n=1 Tax=Culicoidibacter larvae TaxID=2579976 RepID=A0A5R8QBJ1_9FIRM|nr:GNAT family N-acetyltransferase [Culicoidibacter larvae]TLG72698.1 GNAT family N-acetyltransferase [Culicoidibacter larvae]